MNIKVIAVLVVVVVAAVVPAYSYFSVEEDIFTVASTEVKKIDGEDQYRITLVRVRDGERMVMRNEDTTMYLKWDSADVQGDADIAAKTDDKVRVSYMGWRSNWFSWFWNVLSIEKIDA